MPMFYVPFILSLFLNLLIWLIIFLKLPATVNWIPLHYNAYLGIDWIGPWLQIFIYPSISLLIILVNLLIIIFIHKKEKNISLVLNFTGPLVQFIILGGLATLVIKYFV